MSTLWTLRIQDISTEGKYCQAITFSSVLSHLNKNLTWRTLEPSACHSSQTDRITALGSQKDHIIALKHISVTAQFYLENSRKIHSWGVRACLSKDVKRRERGRERETKSVCSRERERDPGPLALLFICFFLPLGLVYVNWTSQECCLFYLRSSLWSLDLPLFYFHWLFPSLSFSHHHSGPLFPILTTQHYYYF